QVGQRFHGLVEDVILPFAGGPEVGGDSAVGEIYKRRAQRRARGGDRNWAGALRRRGTSAATQQRLECRQRDAGADALKKAPAAEIRQTLAVTICLGHL